MKLKTSISAAILMFLLVVVYYSYYPAYSLLSKRLTHSCKDDSVISELDELGFFSDRPPVQDTKIVLAELLKSTELPSALDYPMPIGSNKLNFHKFAVRKVIHGSMTDSEFYIVDSTERSPIGKASDILFLNYRTTRKIYTSPWYNPWFKYPRPLGSEREFKTVITYLHGSRCRLKKSWTGGILKLNGDYVTTRISSRDSIETLHVDDFSSRLKSAIYWEHVDRSIHELQVKLTRLSVEIRTVLQSLI